jgi:hypothetical protein
VIPGARLARSGLAALALAAAACESSPLSAPRDGSLVLRANPRELTVDFTVGPSDEEVRLQELLGLEDRLVFTDATAQLADADGRAVVGVSVRFESERPAILLDGAGREITESPTVRTDDHGTARVRFVFVVSEDAAGAFRLFASSGILRDEEDVIVRVGPPNGLPSANIVIVPSPPLDPAEGGQAVGRPVSFQGTSSKDPDGDPISLWRWTLRSSNPDPGRPNPEILEGPALSGFDRIFSNPQRLSVTLEVTDDPRAPERFAEGAPVAYSPLSATIADYPIVTVLCRENTAPTAVIAGEETIQVRDVPGRTVTVRLDGTLSSDRETALDDYVWNCGSGQPAIEIGNGSKADCQYRVEATPRSFVASLQVRDRGTGLPDPSTGTFPCAKLSETDTVTVVVSPLEL